MKILHTADLHLGQIIYQNYDRSDEHQHFFAQLKEWCRMERPDVLLVSGDVFDIQQPSATVKQTFTEFFVDLHRHCPDLHIVITAGNHDSASRIHADRAVWRYLNTHLVGLSPRLDAEEGWEEDYLIRLDCGYVVALPYMVGERREQVQALLNRIAAENKAGKPVVVMGHTAVTGLDILGHSFEIGKLRTQDVDSWGTGYDYLALGHIHKPQTIGHQEDAMKEEVVYPAPVIRYAGSALHVSCDEVYPHTVSLVEIDRHEGEVKVRQLRIDEWRHFYVLPADGSSFTEVDDAIQAVKAFAGSHKRGYIRLRFEAKVALSSNFNQMVYDLLEPYGEEIRYNPKIVWTGMTVSSEDETLPTFEVAELQQMTDPMCFIEKTMDQYPDLDLEELREAFEEVRNEIERLREEEVASRSKTTRAKAK